jgi:hypothetical protein
VPHSALEVGQQAGRAGRGGLPALAAVVVDGQNLAVLDREVREVHQRVQDGATTVDDALGAGKLALRDHARECKCRHVPTQGYLEGSGKPCRALAAALCDLCAAHQLPSDESLGSPPAPPPGPPRGPPPGPPQGSSRPSPGSPFGPSASRPAGPATGPGAPRPLGVPNVPNPLRTGGGRSAPELAREEASRRHACTTRLARELGQRLPACGGRCPLCSADGLPGPRTAHLSACPSARGLCPRCLGQHRAGSCPYRGRNFRSNGGGVCSACGVRDSRDAGTFHSEAASSWGRRETDGVVE